jgi:L-ascorbate metabolism protein UlaG (beta-lactamase superfamily)
LARLLPLSLLVTTAGCLSVPRYHGPTTDHFDGTRFLNPSGARPHRSAEDLLKWQSARDPGLWSWHPDAEPGPRPPRRVAKGALRVTFINHATTLIQQDGVNVLTDPIWAERASPFLFVGPRRVRPPGLKLSDLPPLDAVVISHNHYDHLDVATLKKLQRGFPRLRIITGLGNKAFLEREGLFNVTELDWWQSTPVGALSVTSVPTQHFSNRGLTDPDFTLWTGFVFSGPAGKSYFAGDTGFGPHFEQVGQRLGPFRLAVLPIGAYRPEWFMSPIHVTPEQAVQAAKALRARVAVPMHYGTFALADDGETEPVDRLLAATRDDPKAWRVLDFGEGFDVP